MSGAMKTKRWWWIALSCLILVLFTIPVSFYWIVGWSDSANRWYIYVEHGVLHGNNLQLSGATAPVQPWYGTLEIFRSSIYDPWIPFPSFTRNANGSCVFHFPLHLPLLALLVVVVFPILPAVVKRRRRKAGLCVTCEYDLTGNVSGVCPECGTKIEQ